MRLPATLVVLLLSWPLVGACSPSGGTGALLVERTSSGGMCQAGPCLDKLTVADDGAWKRRDEAGRTGSGRLGRGALDDLRTAASASPTPMGAPTSGPGCSGGADGRTTTYTWTVAGAPASTTSCGATGLPVVAALDTLAERLR